MNVYGKFSTGKGLVLFLRATQITTEQQVNGGSMTLFHPYSLPPSKWGSDLVASEPEIV